MSTVSYPTLVAPAIQVPAVRVPEPGRKRWTREEYHRLGEQGWFQDQRVELIDGDIILLSPQSPQHAAGSHLVWRLLEREFGDEYWVRHHLPATHGDYSEPEPDVSVIRGSVRDFVAVHPTTAILIVEVSRSSLKYDKQTKQHLYACMGVPEYWVLDLIHRQLLVHRDPIPDTTATFGHRYQSIAVIGEGGIVSPLEKPGAILKVADMLP